MGSSDGEAACDCKLGRVADKWDLHPATRALVTAWQDDGESLRSLAGTFNRRLLGRAMAEGGTTPLDGEVGNYYRLLTGDDVSRGMVTQAEHRLAEYGVDVDSIRDDFVSYQTVNRHLKDCVGLREADRTDPLDVAAAKDRVYSLRHRTREVTEQTLAQLDGTEDQPFDDFEVYVEISARCNECGAHLGLEGLLDGETCRCSDE